MSSKTKLAQLLQEKGWSQVELRLNIFEKTGYNIGADRISKMVNGTLTNYSISTAKIFADVLDVSLDELID